MSTTEIKLPVEDEESYAATESEINEYNSFLTKEVSSDPQKFFHVTTEVMLESAYELYPKGQRLKGYISTCKNLLKLCRKYGKVSGIMIFELENKDFVIDLDKGTVFYTDR